MVDSARIIYIILTPLCPEHDMKVLYLKNRHGDISFLSRAKIYVVFRAMCSYTLLPLLTLPVAVPLA